MKNRKGFLAGLAVLGLNILIFGFLPIPMFSYAIVSILGELISQEQSALYGMICSTAILLISSIFFIYKMKRSKKSFDWLVLLFLIQFIFLNGVALKFLEFSNQMPQEIVFTFVAKVIPFFAWIYPLIGWYYDRYLS